jgi:hypothetical protein
LFNHTKRRQLHATGLLAFFLSLIAGQGAPAQNRQQHVYVIEQLATQRTMTIGEELFSVSELFSFLQTVTKTRCASMLPQSINKNK